MKHLRAEDVGVYRAVDAAVVCGRVVNREDDFGAVVAASIGAVMHRTIIPGNIIRGAASRWRQRGAVCECVFERAISAT